jgi:zona occludens toxin (predicted ATPase)
MAIQLIFGVTGSGKTFKAVKEIYDSFIDTKSPTFNKYMRFYTNIADFQFDKFEGRAIPLVPNDFMLLLSKLRIMFIQGRGESEIIEVARSLDLLDCLIVWDEAQTYFSKKNDVLMWWVEYQRHLHQDIILIAQSPRRILSEYSDLAHLFYRANPPSLRVSDSITYKRYAESKLAKNSFIETFSLKPDNAIFALYTSGANEKPKKIIYKFIIIGSVLVVLVGLIFYYVSSRWSHGGDNVSNSPSVKKSVKAPISSHVFTVACVGFDCSYLGELVSMSDLNVKEKEFNIFPLTTTLISDGVNLRTYSYNADFIKGVFNVSLPDSAIN